MDNNNFSELGLGEVSLQDNAATSTGGQPTSAPKPAAQDADPVPILESAPVSTGQPGQSDQSDQADDTAKSAQAQSDDDILSNLSDEEAIDLFIEGIMEEKGVEAPTEEIKADLKQDLKNQLLEQIDRSLIGELPDDKLEELNRMATTDGKIDPEIVAKMVEEANLNVTEITAMTMARFREIYLGQEKTEQTEE